MTFVLFRWAAPAARIGEHSKADCKRSEASQDHIGRTSHVRFRWFGDR